jgi:hypothetical protein
MVTAGLKGVQCYSGEEHCENLAIFGTAETALKHKYLNKMY